MPFSVEYNLRRTKGSLNVSLPIDGEKKAKKRQYEEIQPDVEDFASQSSPAEPPQVLHRRSSRSLLKTVHDECSLIVLFG